MEPEFEPSASRSGTERRVAEASLITNGVTWYLRSRLSVDDQRLSVATPRTIFGVIPTGRHRFTLDLGELTPVAIGTRFYPERLGVAVTLAAAAVLVKPALGTVLLGVGAVAFLLLSFIAVVRIERPTVGRDTVPVCLAHLPRARRFLADVETLRMAAHGDARGEP